MDVGRSFSYVFEDPRWVSKVAIGGAIFLVGVLFSFLIGLPLLAAVILMAGYTLTVTKNVAEGSATPLPEWNDFGGFFMKGLYAAIGSVIVFIPGIILICCTVAIGAAAGNLSSNQDNANVAGPLGVLAFCFQCLYLLYAFIAGIYLYAPLTRYALNGQLSTFWDFGGNLAFIRSNPGGYVLALIMAIIAGFVGGLGFILCVIPGFFTTFWAQLVSAHVFGQYARSTPATTMPPVSPMAPPPMTPTMPA